MKNILILFVIAMFAISSCKDSNTPEPLQPVIMNDTSANTGRLQVRLYDINSNPVGNAEIRLFANYNDLNNDLPLLKVSSIGNGVGDFGFILIGNYYLIASKNNGSGTIADTAAAQVISQRTTLRTMILN